jgi:hypothetical protein
MTKEQLGELAEALSILSAKSSIVKEKEELKQLMESNISSEEVRRFRAYSRCVTNIRPRNPNFTLKSKIRLKSHSTSVSEA